MREQSNRGQPESEHSKPRGGQRPVAEKGRLSQPEATIQHAQELPPRLLTRSQIQDANPPGLPPPVHHLRRAADLGTAFTLEDHAGLPADEETDAFCVPRGGSPGQRDRHETFPSASRTVPSPDLAVRSA